MGCIATFVMIGVGATIDLRDGLPSRVPNDVAIAAAGAFDVDETFKRRCSNFSPQQVSTDVLCRIGASADPVPTFMLWGDSHAYAIASAVSDAAVAADRLGVFAGSGGCAPLLGVSRTAMRAFPCEAFNDAVIDLIRRDAGADDDHHRVAMDADRRRQAVSQRRRRRRVRTRCGLARSQPRRKSRRVSPRPRTNAGGTTRRG